jgi:LmbE family N-acetylglucosaminyl deacetylase
MKKKCLIIEPHSDDSLIAAGGFLLKFSKQYDYFFCLVTASDLNLRHGFVGRDQRIFEYSSYVSRMNGQLVEDDSTTDAFPLDFESKLDLYPRAELVRRIENVINLVDPDLIMTMGPSFHHDHTIIYESVIAATRPTVKRSLKQILLMENATYSHELYNYRQPTFYVQLTEKQLEEKVSIFNEIFSSQKRTDINMLSSSGMQRWAAYRGIEARCEYAEAFVDFININ